MSGVTSSLEALGYAPFFSAQLELLNAPALRPGRVIGHGQDSYRLAGTAANIAQLSGRLRHQLSAPERPVVGDWVAVIDDASHAVIQHVLDRRSAISRRAAGSEGERQLIAANVDITFIVTSANRDFNLPRLERYLAVVRDSGATPVIVLNKIDLDADSGAKLGAIQSVSRGATVVGASALLGEGLDELRSLLGVGVTAALLGSSGVGKSSIMNRLLGRDLQATGQLRADGKGRHTTSSRELVELPTGGLLLDTPGMREFGLVDHTRGLDQSFAEIAARAANCHFADCRHAEEPGCAVLAAVAEGSITQQRLSSYRKLQRELVSVERRRDPAQSGRAKQRWKSVHKAMRARSKVDPKLERY